MNLSLPKTRVFLQNGTLQRLDSNQETVLASFDVADITGVQIENKKEYGIALVIAFAFLGVGLVGKFYIDAPVWSWLAFIICLAISGICIAVVETKYLVVETRTGKVRYPTADAPEDVDGFVLSLQAFIERARQNERAPVSGPIEETQIEVPERGGTL